MDADFIFVYGLLKSMYNNEPAKFIRKNCSLTGEGFFPGKLIDIGSYPGAVFEEDSETKVYGEVYRVDQNKAELVRFLDNFEGVGHEFDQPNEYRREIIPVQTQAGVIEASCYVYNRNPEEFTLIESGRYENPLGIRE